MRINNLILVLFFAFLTTCARSTAPEAASAPGPAPEAKSIEAIIHEEQEPRRLASLRLVEKGRMELERSAYERAALRFSSAIEIDSKNPYAYFYLALTRTKTGRWSESLELFRRAADLFRSDSVWRAESLAYEGECHFNLGKKNDAKKSFEAALKEESSNVRAKEGMANLESER